MNITLISALAQNRVIGKEGGLPWSLPDDLQHFKKLTLHKPVVMGHATARSLGKPLPHRTNLVLSRGDVTLPNFIQVHSKEDAIAHAEREQASELCVIGGAQIYALFLSVATRLELTHVEGDVNGDTIFPYFDMNEWECVQGVRHEADDRHAFAFRMASYVRKARTLPASIASPHRSRAPE